MGGGAAPQQLHLSQAPTPPRGNTPSDTNQHAPRTDISLCPRALTPTPLLLLPSAQPLPPRVLSGRSVLETRACLHTPCRDVTWGRTLRHSGGEGRRRNSPSQDSHSLWAVGPGTDSAAPPTHTPWPASHALGSAGSRLCTGGLPATPASRPQPTAPPGPPYPLEAPGVVAGGPWEIPRTPVPRGARCARPPPPPEGGARGRCPMERGGAVCSRSRDPSRSCVSQPPRPPRIMRHRPWLAGPAGL